MSFLFRPYTTEDTKCLNNAFSQVFKTYRKQDFWHTRYQNCPDGYQLTLAWTEAGDLAGCYACTLHQVYDNLAKRNLLCGQVRDIFTVARFRGQSLQRQGLLVQLYENFILTLRDKGCCDFLFGFPSIIHLRLGKLRMQYSELPPWQTYTCTMWSAAASPQKLQVLRIESFDDAFDRLWERQKTGAAMKVVRSSDFLNWRFAPSNGYEIRVCRQYLSSELEGYLVVKPDTPGKVLLLDFCWPTNLQLALEFWRQVCAELVIKGVGEVDLHCVGHAIDPALLFALGFRVKAVIADNFPVFRCLSDRTNNIQVQEHLCLTLADTDLY